MKIQNILKVALLSIFISGSASATLIANGDFSSGLSDWTTRGDVTIGNGGPGMDGDFAYLGYTNDEYPNNRLWQDFDVSGLDKIQISFDWFFEYQDNSSKRDVFVSILRDLDNSPVQNITLDRLTTNMTPRSGNVNLFSGYFAGTFDISDFEEDARLRFRLSENLGVLSRAGIDNVSVEVAPVPEPSTVLLFGVGLAGLVAVRRKK